MSKKILIVEDEKPMAKALELKLTSEGFEVEIAADGVKAIELLESGAFDLMLLDLVMPGLDGFGVLQQIKDKNIKTNVIVSSNLGQEEDFKRAKDLGAVDYLVKSDTTLAQIVEKIKTYIG
ncbi:response regulator [Candidatus Falkowbacteria bacterium CG10_big_fil_rev_8_21_14_0_10_39_11]|uniref:Response regulator n=1 Tax=Candidatus Falkowbacteria bacterium CG10_big_fil_rev_8_21_14_0_10_39_11 TaxID=1974565 RepID=A0A2H0V417_9BACT|nr:MAG: response regulator [Candidatus Falkowbacteria bacterium CG10_big_fil_rev_8_21_14_0_10_39_11]